MIKRNLIGRVLAAVFVVTVAWGVAGCGPGVDSGTAEAGDAGQAEDTGQAEDAGQAEDPTEAGDVLSSLTDALSQAGAAADVGGPAQAGGSATITIDGATSTVTLDPCRIMETTDVNLSISSGNSSGLLAMLPPTAGPFTSDDFGTVILPPPESGDDEYRTTVDINGEWAMAGEGATGHIEGTVHLLSGITSSEDPAIPFSIDFECTSVTDLTSG